MILAYSKKIKCNHVRAYDFPIESEVVAQEKVHLNSFWLCAGKDVQRIFAGAWLLGPGDRVIAYMHEPKHVEFNPHEKKTYLRIWFVCQEECSVDLRAVPKLKIRVALNNKTPNNDFYLLCTGNGVELVGEQLDDDVPFDTRILKWPWLNSALGLRSLERWKCPQAQAAVSQRPPKPALRAPPPPQVQAKAQAQAADMTTSSFFKPRDALGRTPDYYGNVDLNEVHAMNSTAELYDPMNPGM